MTGKDKIFAALSRDGTSELPVTIPYEGIYIRDRWDELTDLPWWYLYSPKTEHYMQYMRDVHEKFSHDWISIHRLPDPEDEQNIEVNESGGRVLLTDKRTNDTTELFRPPPGGHDMTNQTDSEKMGDLPETRAEFDDYMIEKRMLTTFIKRISAGKFASESFFPERCHISGIDAPLLSCFKLWGFERCMTMFYDNPGLIRYASGFFLERRLEGLQKVKDAGTQLLWVQDCYSDMISPGQYKEFCLPYLRIMLEGIRGLGLYSVQYFTGNFHDRLDFLVEAGADALALEEGKKGFTADVIELAEALTGRVAMVSNLDTVTLLQSGSERELRGELTRHREAARIMKGRFLFGLGSPITPHTSVARVREYIKIAREYGKL